MEFFFEPAKTVCSTDTCGSKFHFTICCVKGYFVLSVLNRCLTNFNESQWLLVLKIRFSYRNFPNSVIVVGQWESGASQVKIGACEFTVNLLQVPMQITFNFLSL